MGLSPGLMHPGGRPQLLPGFVHGESLFLFGPGQRLRLLQEPANRPRGQGDDRGIQGSDQEA